MFSVAGAIAKPMIATVLLTVMCHVRSFHLPDVIEMRMVTKPATRYGGQVSTRVIVVSKPRVLTTLAVSTARQ